MTLPSWGGAIARPTTRAGRAARKGRKPGPPKGTPGHKRMREYELGIAIERAAKKVGEDHPIVKESLDAVLRIARAEPGFRGRNVGTRMSAYRELLNRLAGIPREQEPGKSERRPVRWTFGKLEGVERPADKPRDPDE